MDVYSLLGSGAVLTLVGLCFKMTKDGDGKIDRLYRRLDEIKDKVSQDYTRKDVCEVVHKSVDTRLISMATDIGEIKRDIKIILKNNGHG